MNTSCTTWQLLFIKHCISCRFGLLMMSLISVLIVFIRMCHQVRLICRLLVNTHMNIKCKHKPLQTRQGFWLVDFLCHVPFYILLYFERMEFTSRGRNKRYLYLFIIGDTGAPWRQLKVHMQLMTFPSSPPARRFSKVIINKPFPCCLSEIRRVFTYRIGN